MKVILNKREGEKNVFTVLQRFGAVTSQDFSYCNPYYPFYRTPFAMQRESGEGKPLIFSKWKRRTQNESRSRNFLSEQTRLSFCEN